MQVGYRQKSRFWSNSWLSKIAGYAKCQKHLPTTKLTHHWLSIDCWTCELTTMQCRSHSRRLTSECLFVTACSMDEYAEEKRTEKNLIVRSGISEAETSNNKRPLDVLYWFYRGLQTRSIARPLRQQSFLLLETGTDFRRVLFCVKIYRVEQLQNTDYQKKNWKIFNIVKSLTFWKSVIILHRVVGLQSVLYYVEIFPSKLILSVLLISSSAIAEKQRNVSVCQ